MKLRDKMAIVNTASIAALIAAGSADGGWSIISIEGTSRSPIGG
jgi:hypothetical protein